MACVSGTDVKGEAVAVARDGPIAPPVRHDAERTSKGQASSEHWAQTVVRRVDRRRVEMSTKLEVIIYLCRIVMPEWREEPADPKCRTAPTQSHGRACWTSFTNDLRTPEGIKGTGTDKEMMQEIYLICAPDILSPSIDARTRCKTSRPLRL